MEKIIENVTENLHSHIQIIEDLNPWEDKSTPIKGPFNVFCNIKEEKWKFDKTPSQVD